MSSSLYPSRRPAPLLAGFLAACLLAGCASSPPLAPQEEAMPPQPTAVAAPTELPREFRAFWIATVANIDWPSKPGLPTAKAKAELLSLLDLAAELRLNAVVLQVRPAADALYASDLEPWSPWLVANMGEAPSPAWDPLAFAVAEAHERGLELHAWFNPYRASHPTHRGERSASHVVESAPELVHKYGRYHWMDPSLKSVQERSLAVIEDVVRRYDLDGIHVDDYFYPYPIRDDDGEEVDFPDAASYAAYQAGGGGLSRADWRRDAVNTFVRAMYSRTKAIKPHVKVGISPFGIWRPGHPPQIKGFDQYEKLFADARKWWREGWVDYLTPQLYWPIAPPDQGYTALLRWWSEENAMNRHLWPGNAAYRIQDGSAKQISAKELAHQVEWTRILGAGGNVHFSAKVFAKDVDGVNAQLRDKVYQRAALVPASPWIDAVAPAAPFLSRRGNGRVSAKAANFDEVRLFVVYERRGESWTARVVPTRSGEAEVTLAEGVEEVLISAIDRSGNESLARPLPVQATLLVSG